MQKLDNKTFIERSNKIHNGFYDYSLTNYEHSLKKVKIKCPTHGFFEMKPSNHINNKQGCFLCARKKTSDASKKGLGGFLEEIKNRKNFKNYDFSKIKEFKTLKDPIVFFCKKHGEYKTAPRNVLRSNFFGCKDCRIENDRFDTLKFVEISSNLHKNFYNYDKVKYFKAHDEVIITCPKHGDYTCKPYIHMAGGGFCPKCTTFVSSYELEIEKFLKSMEIENINTSVRNIKDIKEIDILCNDQKIAIEFNGLYWHSDLFKEKNYHQEKTNKMNSLGYRLIHIFEDDWIEKRSVCESILRNSFNKNENRIFARKCEIKEVCLNDSKEFLKMNHIQGHCISKYRYGLYHNDKLVMLLTLGNNRKNLGTKSKVDEFELLRMCSVLNTNIVGGASKLLDFFIKKHNPKKITSYCDKKYGTGIMYEKLGFKHQYDTKPNYFYVKGNKKYNRFSFRKDVLIKKGYDKTKTESQIMKKLGYNKIYDCGSMKFEWNKKIS
jgi:very-short-patch-repair endonuclease